MRISVHFFSTLIHDLIFAVVVEAVDLFVVSVSAFAESVQPDSDLTGKFQTLAPSWLQ